MASIVFGGSGVGIAKSLLRKCVVSLMYEGINATSGLRKWSMKMESFSVESQNLK